MANYDVSDLKVLSPQEHIRTRKGMYIGEGHDPRPLFNEIFDNALDEQNSGFSNLTKIKIDYDNNTYEITDYGRGFPQGKLNDPVSGKDIEAVELLCTTAFSGGKFDHSAYRLSSGLHGLGCLVTNSLSEYFNIKTWRNNSLIEYNASKGFTISVTYSAPTNISSGTTVTFKPDAEMFTDSKIPLTHIINRCKVASAFGMKNELTVIEGGTSSVVDTSATVYDLLPEDDEGISEYYRYDFTVKDDSTGESATVALKYTSDTKSFYRGYTNLLYNSSGGSHHKMLDSSIYNAWSKYKIPNIKWNDCYLGLRAVVAVFISDTEFSSQTKEKLAVPIQNLSKLGDLIKDKINEWLDNNDEIRESLIKRFQEYRNSQDKLLARKEIKSLLWVNNSKNGVIRRNSQVRKLRECDSKSKQGTELFLCEGDSALGSVLSARNPHTQAALPLRGKVLNVSRFSNPKDALSNEETRSIINAIGAGIMNDTDPDKSRYEKIIFLCDSDSDGLNICALLAGMFISLLPNLVKAGMVYSALPPLYGWQVKSTGEYHFTNKMSEIPEDILKRKEFARYKGLGEMDPDELKISTMDPSTRRLIRINYPDDIKIFNGILTSSSIKFKMLEDQGVIKYE